jgi:hypothetical protein
VLLHPKPLLVAEGALFAQQRGVEPELADVVEQGG